MAADDNEHKAHKMQFDAFWGKSSQHKVSDRQWKSAGYRLLMATLHVKEKDNSLFHFPMMQSSELKQNQLFQELDVWSGLGFEPTT